VTSKLNRTPDTPVRIGSELTVEVEGPSDLGRDLFAVRSVDPFPKGDWTLLLHGRRGSLVDAGQELDGWVYKLDPALRRIYISDENFGRLPVSSQMRQRYLRALRAVLDSEGEPEPDAVSEVKGMFGRVVKQDQRDWFSVYVALGEPSHADARTSWQDLGALGRALRRSERELATEAWGRLAGMGVLNRLRSAEETLTADAASEPLTLELREFAAEAPPVTVEPSPNAGYLLHEVSRAKLERANRDHQHLLSEAADRLRTCGLVPMESRLIDLYCRVHETTRLFEAKTTTRGNWKNQIRKGVSQLREYRFLYEVRPSELYLLLDGPPREHWVIDFLASENIGCLWLDGAEFSGPDALRALTA
jgi:hypothetical protein